jgi:FkbM family methyltransferase
VTLKQSFYDGKICLDAVEHSWAWTGDRRYKTFDKDLQDQLLTLSEDYELFIDIGSNIGAMTLSLLLRNPTVKALCIDPNARAVSLLEKSLILNKLTERASIIEAVVSDQDGELMFDDTGSVVGHISDRGKKVKSIDFLKLIDQHSDKKCLIKIDIEGFEVNLLELTSKLNNLSNLCFVIELHPMNFNNIGNPNFCLECLLNSGANVKDLKGQQIKKITNDKNFIQLIVSWNDAK